MTKMALLSPAVLVNGQVVGTWKRKLDKRSVVISTTLSRKLTGVECKALRGAIAEYGEYLGLEARSFDCQP
jgi:hypothetical protein